MGFNGDILLDGVVLLLFGGTTAALDDDDGVTFEVNAWSEIFISLSSDSGERGRLARLPRDLRRETSGNGNIPGSSVQLNLYV